MSMSQAKNFRFFIQLQRSLKSYGLNPYEWRLDRAATAATGRPALRHRQDENFRFSADWAIQNGVAKYRTLKLISL